MSLAEYSALRLGADFIIGTENTTNNARVPSNALSQSQDEKTDIRSCVLILYDQM